MPRKFTDKEIDAAPGAVDGNDVLPAMCGTCPFREGSPYADLAEYLAVAACTGGNRVCHNTSISSISGDTGRPGKLCRGARDVQLAYFHDIGFLPEPTDAAWAAKLAEFQPQKPQPSDHQQ